MTYKTIEPNKYDPDDFCVMEYGTWKSGLLKGQEKKTMIASYSSPEEAKKVHPDADIIGYSSPTNNTYDHLPDEEMSAREEEAIFHNA